MPEKNNDNQARREKEAVIFDAACRVLREKGFHQARMADIAAEAGISYGLVYHYYRSKNDLFDAVMDEWWSGLDRLFDELAGSGLPVEEKLAGVIEYFLDQYMTRPDLVHIFITEISRSSTNLTPERLARFKTMLARTEELIEGAQSQGALRTDLRARYLTYCFVGSLEALLSTMVLENQSLKAGAQKQRLAQALLTMFMEGARP